MAKARVSLESILSNVTFALRRSWCYRRILFAILCAFCMLLLLKLSDPLDRGNYDYGQDANQLNNPPDTISKRMNLSLNNTLKYCYRNDDEYGETIVFINLNNRLTDLDICSIKLASLFNPQRPICFLHTDATGMKKLNKSLSGLRNVQMRKLDVLEVFRGTPLFEWYLQTTVHANERRYFHSELQDALRAAYMYKYGGTYLDMDVWTLRSLDKMKVNTMAKEANHLRYLSNFVMSFQKGHPFMRDVVHEFNRTVNASRWGSGGTLLVSKVYAQKWKTAEGKNKVNVISADLLYPVHFGHGPILYQFHSFDRVTNMTKNAYTVHLWREVFRQYWTGRRKARTGSFVQTVYEQFCR